MWDFDLYARLDLADAWAIIGPVNWYGPTSNLKLLFDRLVCANGGNPREDPIEHKNPELAMELEHAPEWEGLSLNHLEGRTAAFFCYSDAGANEMDSRGRPKKLRHKGWFDPEQEPFADMRQAYAPSGMAVPVQRGRGARRPLEPRLHGHGCRLQRQPSRRMGVAYSDNQAEDMIREDQFMSAFDGWTDRFTRFVAEKGKARRAKREGQS
jgi:hypothetical protein